MIPIPVFIISFNRGNLLLKCIEGMKHFSYPITPIIHDNGSSDIETLHILDKLEQDGVKVYRGDAIKSPEELNNINNTITDFFLNHPISNYVVTDCDIDMSITNSDTLKLFTELLQLFPEAECVGPMLKISDIDESYPLYTQVMNGHIKQFWHKKPSWVETSIGNIAYQECNIDTTFALHRGGEPFNRLKSAIRVYEPYEALHLDWYEEFRNLDKDYSLSSHPHISHWNNSFRINYTFIKKQEKIKHTKFYVVLRMLDGELIEFTRYIN